MLCRCVRHSGFNLEEQELIIVCSSLFSWGGEEDGEERGVVKIVLKIRVIFCFSQENSHKDKLVKYLLLEVFKAYHFKNVIVFFKVQSDRIHADNLIHISIFLFTYQRCSKHRKNIVYSLV